MRRPAALFHIALAVAFTASQPPPAHADNAKRPPVPPNIEVQAGLEGPADTRAFREVVAIGSQDYICLPSGCTFFGPQVTLFSERGRQFITHFVSPNPFENGTSR